MIQTSTLSVDTITILMLPIVFCSPRIANIRYIGTFS